MKNILVPTDFSTTAWNAINYALHLFKETDCIFYFLNTYTPEICSSRFMADAVHHSHHNATAAVASEKGLEKTILKIEKNDENPHHCYKAISSFSLLIDEVKEAVLSFEIDFIIMGTKGVSSKENIFMGRNTVRILKNIRNCPILLIPGYVEFKTLKKIAFVTDFRRFYSSSELAPLLEMATSFNTPIVVVNVQDNSGELTDLQQFNYEILNKNLEGIPHSFYNITEAHPFSVSIQLFLNNFKIQILAMSNCSNSYMDFFCRELVIERSVFHSEVPVMVIPEGEKFFYSSNKSKKLSSKLSKRNRIFRS